MKQIFWVVLIVALFFGRPYAEAEDIIAKVGEKVITKTDFDVLAKHYAAEKGKDIANDEKFREDLLDILLKRTALAEMARKKGLDKRKDVLLMSELLVNGLLMNVLLKEEVIDKIEVTEQDMKLYYAGHANEFKEPEMARVRHILLSTMGITSDVEKEKVKGRLEEILKRIRAGEDFGKLASEFSDDAVSKNKGGDLGTIKRGLTVKEFEDTAFALKPGELSGIVETKFGYHIIKCEEKTEAGTKPFAEVKDTLREKVLQQIKQGKIKDITEKAMKEAKIEKHPELLSADKK